MFFLFEEFISQKIIQTTLGTRASIQEKRKSNTKPKPNRNENSNTNVGHKTDYNTNSTMVKYGGETQSSSIVHASALGLNPHAKPFDPNKTKTSKGWLKVPNPHATPFNFEFGRLPFNLKSFQSTLTDTVDNDQHGHVYDDISSIQASREYHKELANLKRVLDFFADKRRHLVKAPSAHQLACANNLLYGKPITQVDRIMKQNSLSGAVLIELSVNCFFVHLALNRQIVILY